MIKTTYSTKVDDQTVQPLDEFFHPVGDDPTWSESYYFYYFDPSQEIGGVTRMGFRANDGWADYMHILFLGGSRIIFCYERRDMGRDDQDLAVGGLTLERGEPFENWTIRFDGTGADLDDGRILVTPRRDRPADWEKRAAVKMEIDFRRLADPYYMLREPNRCHFEQVGSAAGWIDVDGFRRELNGFGLRDKSWGPRPWTDTSEGTKKETTLLATGPAEGLFNLWITAVAGPHLGFALQLTQDPDGGLRSRGFLFQDGAYHAAERVEMESDFEPGTVFHVANTFHAEFEGGRQLAGKGTVLGLGPSKIPQPGGATLVNSGMTRFELDTGDTAVGSSEYWIAVKRDQAR